MLYSMGVGVSISIAIGIAIRICIIIDIGSNVDSVMVLILEETSSLTLPKTNMEPKNDGF